MNGMEFLEKYGKDMEFCQLQINYVDWEFQSANKKVALLRKWGIPVWVMEPVRGGKLASLSPENEAKLKAMRPDERIPAWAFRRKRNWINSMSVPSPRGRIRSLSSTQRAE